jgi:hypothetical protein
VNGWTLLLLAAALGLIPGAVAHAKGHNFWLWWALGTALWIVAMPAAILLKPAPPPEAGAEEPREGP